MSNACFIVASFLKCLMKRTQYRAGTLKLLHWKHSKNSAISPRICAHVYIHKHNINPLWLSQAITFPKSPINTSSCALVFFPSEAEVQVLSRATLFSSDDNAGDFQWHFISSAFQLKWGEKEGDMGPRHQLSPLIKLITRLQQMPFSCVARCWQPPAGLPSHVIAWLGTAWGEICQGYHHA